LTTTVGATIEGFNTELPFDSGQTRKPQLKIQRSVKARRGWFREPFINDSVSQQRAPSSDSEGEIGFALAVALRPFSVPS